MLFVMWVFVCVFVCVCACTLLYFFFIYLFFTQVYADGSFELVASSKQRTNRKRHRDTEGRAAAGQSRGDMLPSSATITVSDDEELDAPPPYAAFQQQGQTANSAHHSRQNGRPRISDGPSSIGLGYSGFRPNAQSATLTRCHFEFPAVAL